ncbi:hypothetical protein V8E51_011848 [Hyaloscypha variabilis]|uniref:BZIP domain-containing protein n=1 Tax=Hyaloscypha variabilis (strain UAMH 11265 / GT02V1 / F) TaxID=1149755 RepID=A0A2J6QRK2_HYAVF|nr:hypothetical protein L207DRAFT_539313 [Hyaloscypha variabilis F]
MASMRGSSEFSVQSPPTNREPTKRKGGRKAMYTEEARKQRNRDAQAAFRERRIEYIKELEERVKAYSVRLRALESKRTDSADECLMLRYKNSLLERILLHKGIDVNAELNTKLWRPVGIPMQSYPAPIQQPSKRKASAVSSSTYHTSLASETTSPISTASETTIPTPPAPTPLSAARPHKRTKILTPPGKYPPLLLLLRELWS